MPRTAMAIAFTTGPEDIADDAIRPRTIMEKYSTGPNCKAKLTMIGEKRIRRMIPTLPPKKDARTFVIKAMPARPCCAIGKPSRHVTAEDGPPGRLSRMDVIE